MGQWAGDELCSEDEFRPCWCWLCEKLRWVFPGSLVGEHTRARAHAHTHTHTNR